MKLGENTQFDTLKKDKWPKVPRVHIEISLLQIMVPTVFSNKKAKISNRQKFKKHKYIKMFSEKCRNA